MEHHDAVYEQSYDLSSTNQGTEYISSHGMVQEIVVHNDNNQQSTVNCEMSGIEIMMPSDCINVQEQCSSNIILASNIDTNYTHEKQVSNDVSQINNLEGDISGYNQSHAEVHEQFTIQNSESFPENYETTNTVVIVQNQENDKEFNSENSISSNEQVSQVKVKETISSLPDNQSVNTLAGDLNDNQEVSYGETGRNLKEELVTSSVVAENIESMDIDTLSSVTTSTVVNENIIVESYNQSQNHCANEDHEMLYPNNSDSHYSDVNVQSKLSEVTENAELLIRESSVKEITVISNSDDVAILTEFNSTTEACQKNHNDSEEAFQSNEEEINYQEPTEQKYVSVESETEKTHADSTENSTKTNNVEIKNEDDTTVHENAIEDDDDDLDIHLSSQTSENQRKVIQDIFDDWQDENGEDDNNQAEHQDSVELELQNLLNDGVQDTSSNASMAAGSLNNFETYPNSNKSNETTPVKQKVIKSESSSTTSRRSSNRSPKPVHNSSKDHSLGRSKSPKDQSESKGKFQSPRPGVKVPGHHLTSQIASTAEVNEVLKERLREKQKDLVTPKTADLVFVKKITARLSSKLAGAVTGNVPPIIPPISQNEGDKPKLDKSVESSKASVTDSKELLAILEGDDDPDWTDLKSTEENKTLSPGESHSSKLNPVLEKELALKQLQELPSLPTKKGSPGASKKTKKTSKSNQLDDPLESKSAGEKIKADPASSAESGEEDSIKKDAVSKSQKENSKENVQNDSIELNVEESRSGRKRKPTEKARQHELAVKRQKTIKGKATETKKQESSQETSDTVSEESKPSSPKPDQPKSDSATSKAESKTPKSESKQSKSTKSESEDENNVELKTPTGKKPTKQLGVSKKDGRISKRKLAVRNLMRKKLAGQKTSKGKIQTEALTKEDAPSKTTTEKSATSGATTRPKKSSEIDKLLQDEGVVNLLYDVEQPDSRRLVPITKSQKKVMDVDKAERELKLRTKLVRNAVMRLRNSNASTIKISPRSRRSAVPSQQTSPQAEKKPTEPTKSPKSATSVVSSDFTLPGKSQRNAADASRIIRRHSSSSFSSASASPRVSVDMPPDSMKLDFPEMQSKTKRKNLQNNDEKKTKKKSISKTDESDDESKTKKESVKKSKSNTNVVTKNKKAPKSRSSLDSNSGDARSRSPEKITACLAEAASALSTFNSRSSNAASRKKGSANSPEVDDENLDVKKLSSYKEIIVKQHGHLVQLILTPSSTTSGIRNAITIQVLKELREALLILKKHDDCRVVLLTSTGTSFCEGLDVSYLVSSNKEERKRRAEEMANTIKRFIKTLAEFNKPIVAGVQGAAIGLGVTMLPLFDLVIASDKATFSTPYAKLGQIAEGAAVLTLSHSLGTAVTNELLLGGRTLTASEALRAGLVTRVLWPDKFSSELLPSLKSMSEQSSQSMEATKALLRRSLRKQLDMELESETFLLIEHWYSTECQEAIQSYIEDKGQ